jgi:predicted transcriptional regulator
VEIESLFSSTRWEILKALSQEKLSPIELAEKMKTTSANISQQLRLLELAGLVKSEKTSNSEKGKPRIIYSLVGDSSFIILTSPNFVDKKMLPLSHYHKYMLKTMFVDNFDIQSSLAELYFKIKDHLSMIKIIAADTSSAFIVAENQKTSDLLKKALDDFKKVRISILSLEDFRKKSSVSKLIVLYDPKGLYGGVGINE